MSRDVILQSPGVKFLFLIGDGDREQIAASAFSDQPTQAFEARVTAAEMQIQAHGGGIALHGGGVNLQCGHILIPALLANVLHRCTAPRD